MSAQEYGASRSVVPGEWRIALAELAAEGTGAAAAQVSSVTIQMSKPSEYFDSRTYRTMGLRYAVHNRDYIAYCCPYVHDAAACRLATPIVFLCKCLPSLSPGTSLCWCGMLAVQPRCTATRWTSMQADTGTSSNLGVGSSPPVTMVPGVGGQAAQDPSPAAAREGAASHGSFMTLFYAEVLRNSIVCAWSTRQASSYFPAPHLKCACTVEQAGAAIGGAAGTPVQQQTGVVPPAAFKRARMSCTPALSAVLT